MRTTAGIAFGPDRLIEVSGDVEARAQEQGIRCRSLLPSIVRSLRELPVVPPMPLFDSQFVSVANRLLSSAGWFFRRRHAPAWETYCEGGLARGLAALAEGFKVNRNLIVGLNAVEILGSNLPFALGCTALAVDASAATGGGPVLAYNHDFPPVFGAFLIARRSFPTKGHASLALTYPVMLGAVAGINDAGLAVSLNHAYAMDRHRLPGILPSFLVQACLDQCASVDAAIELIERAGVPNGSMITLVDASRRAVVELTCRRREVRSASDRLLCTFNRYQCAVPRQNEAPLNAVAIGFKGLRVHDANLGRQRRYDALAHSFPDRFSDDALWALLADHGGQETSAPNTICRHQDLNSQTLMSALLRPTEGRISVRYGHPCRAPVRELSLSVIEKIARTPAVA